MLSPGRYQMLHRLAVPADRSAIAGMIVTVDPGPSRRAKRRIEKMCHVLLDRFRVGSAVYALELQATLLLMRRHTSFPAQLTVGEVDEEVGSLLHRYVVMERIVLAELEGFEPVDDDILNRRCRFHEASVQQEAMSTEATEMPIDRFGRHTKITCDLPIGHTANSAHEDPGIELGQSLPVGRTEGLTTEGASAMQTCKPLDAVRFSGSIVETDLLESPIVRQSLVVNTVGVWAVRRVPISELCVADKHIRPVASNRPDTFFEAQPRGRTIC